MTTATQTVPGSMGEHRLQAEYGTTARAEAFYANQVRNYLNPLMREFIGQQEMIFVASADAGGECDVTFRAGPPGFVHVIDEKTLAYPEYRGNGVMATLGNIYENAHIGLLFVDFFRGKVGLHVNGKAAILSTDEVLANPVIPDGMRAAALAVGGQRPERWLLVSVEEAYIHCSKHIPLLQKLDQDRPWGTDDMVAKGGDYFRVKTTPREWSEGV